MMDRLAEEMKTGLFEIHLYPPCRNFYLQRSGLKWTSSPFQRLILMCLIGKDWRSAMFLNPRILMWRTIALPLSTLFWPTSTSESTRPQVGFHEIEVWVAMWLILSWFTLTLSHELQLQGVLLLPWWTVVTWEPKYFLLFYPKISIPHDRETARWMTSSAKVTRAFNQRQGFDRCPVHKDC